MVTVTYKNKTFQTDDKTTLLDSILASGTFMSSSCKDGFCQNCMAKAVKGIPPEASQVGLSESLKAQNCFLPCICIPTEDMEIEDATKNNVIKEDPGISAFNTYAAMALEKKWLNHDVLRFCLMKPEGFRYKAGQFLNITQTDINVTRSYSLASLPCENFIELHIKRIPNGIVSNWICDDVSLGSDIEISGPSGSCYYQQGNPHQPLLLVGIGTGLAPLYGIARDAIESDHQGEIFIFHATTEATQLYYQDELNALVQETNNVQYIPCVLHGEAPENGQQGLIHEVIAEHIGKLTDIAAYLCGDGQTIETITKTLIQADADPEQIYSDIFFSPPQNN